MKPIRSHPYFFLLITLVLAVFLSIGVGSVAVSLGDMLRILTSHLPGISLPATWPAAYETIVIKLRLPRTVLMMITGAALAGSGTAYQGLFRNPLADPYLIGVASGAGLGAVLAMSIQTTHSALRLFAIPVAALLGGLLTVVAVYFLARQGNTLPTTNLILAGVAASSFATALTSYLMLRSSGELRRALGWLLGGATMSGWDPVLAALPYLVVGLGILLTMGYRLNVLQFGDEQASQLRLPVERVRTLVIFASSLAAAAAVSFAGIIGFVGLIVPHVIRLIWGGDYRLLLPLSMIGGAAFLLGADVLARVIISPQVLPVGIITALFGAPFFLWLLRRSKLLNFW